MLQKYKQGELSEEQMEQVEADLLRQMFRKQKDAELRNSLKDLAKNIEDTEGGIKKTEPAKSGLTVVHRSNRLWTWMAAAASVALLAVASWWFFLKPPPTESFNNQTLADTYLKTDAAPVWNTSMDKTTVEQREAKAKEAYTNGDFDNAVKLFEAIPPTKKEHYFFLGIAALKQQKSDAAKAVDNLLKARSLANGWQEDATNWYLALGYMRLGKTEEARKELTNIVKIGRDNVSRAEDILKKMAFPQ